MQYVECQLLLYRGITSKKPSGFTWLTAWCNKLPRIKMFEETGFTKACFGPQDMHFVNYISTSQAQGHDIKNSQANYSPILLENSIFGKYPMLRHASMV